ncbi:hypothetical protein EV702DRAFT_1202355 [Suillus placidus]|uniref:Uncharacterized protein n=1 Tax=Suillus placidus TaxID=48579 RepID=A0A9P6ZLS9_9AGAM|nr:hypothetical protein EV702DRAFT_1202355 [Suillus placidus]
MSTLTINKTDNISVCGDVIFLEIDGVLPNWKNYCIKFSVSTPGIKTLVFRLCEGADHPSLCTSAIASKHKPTEDADERIKFEEEEGKVKFEEEVTMVTDVKDIKEEPEDIKSEDLLARLRMMGTATPCIHLPQITVNPDPATRDILLEQRCPWRHIVRPFDASEIPMRLAKQELRKHQMFDWDF